MPNSKTHHLQLPLQLGKRNSTKNFVPHAASQKFRGCNLHLQLNLQWQRSHMGSLACTIMWPAETWLLELELNSSKRFPTNLVNIILSEERYFMPCHVHGTKSEIWITTRSWIIKLQLIPPTTKPVTATVSKARPLITRLIWHPRHKLLAGLQPLALIIQSITKINNS